MAVRGERRDLLQKVTSRSRRETNDSRCRRDVPGIPTRVIRAQRTLLGPAEAAEGLARGETEHTGQRREGNWQEGWISGPMQEPPPGDSAAAGRVASWAADLLSV